MSGLLISASILCYLGVIVRGDGICPGNFSACLVGGFFVFGLAAIVCFIIGLVRRTRKNVPSN